jgi:hypothetical protein
MMVSWFGPQNQAGFGLSVADKTDGGRPAWDTRRDLAACFGLSVAQQNHAYFPVWPQDWWRRDDG